MSPKSTFTQTGSPPHKTKSEKSVALITGASAGLGKEYARLFAADGHPIILVARRQERLHDLASELRSAHQVEAYVLVADLAEPGSVAELYDAVLALKLKVGYLINNAGFGHTGSFSESELEQELGQIRLNILALTDLTHRFLPAMIAARQGAILNISSTSAFQPGPFMATYFATKAFVNSFTEALAFELKGTGVTATAHCPGATLTEFGAVSGNEKNKLFTKGGAASATAVARHGYLAMRAGKILAVHGLLNALLTFFTRLTPRALTIAIAARLNRP